MMLYYLKIYGLMVPVFLAVDLVWLGVVARKFYMNRLGYIMAEKPNWIAAFIFYLLFVAGVLLFTVKPALDRDSLRMALLLGAAFGLVTYATYDLTNLATVKDWPLRVSLVDMVWGA
ncbi:MAG: DUF2177 family protein, partial [Candidatus Sumerlaeota bacterium]